MSRMKEYIETHYPYIEFYGADEWCQDEEKDTLEKDLKEIYEGDYENHLNRQRGVGGGKCKARKSVLSSFCCPLCQGYYLDDDLEKRSIDPC